MKPITLFVFISFVVFKAISQNESRFILVDSETSNPIPFANIIFNTDTSKGTTSDIDGVFTVPQNIVTITISYIGYTSKTLEVASLKSRQIRLEQGVSQLDEVVIENWVNPAHRIIRSAVANKAKNNPENLNAFSYQSYDKIIIVPGEAKITEDHSEKTTEATDSLDAEIDAFFKESHLFITETVSKRKYLKPRLSEDSIIATRTSGFKSPNFALLANSIQPFSFYDDYITLFETDYLNPIAKGSTKKYKFRLKDEYLRGQDTIFAISFEPKANRNFEGLKGLIYINSNGYAVQSVDASTFNSGKIAVTIQQKYNYINDASWFPEQLNFEIKIGGEFGTLNYVGKSYLSEVILNPPLTKKDFQVIPQGIGKAALNKDSAFWNITRQDTLSQKDQRTYVLIDSIGESINLDRIAGWSEGLIKGRLPLKCVDIDLTKILQYNKYEGLRLGAGFYTNDDILENISLGGFAGYGFRDNEWKYGGELLFEIPSRKAINVQLKYENNLKETGRSYFQNNQLLFNPRNLIAEQMDNIEVFSAHVKMKLFRNIDWTIGLNTGNVIPLYDYSFVFNNQTIINYTNTEFNLGINYFFNEQLTSMFNTVSRLPNDDPKIHLSYSRGMAGVFDGRFDYNKIQMILDDSFRTKGLGKTTYRFDAGYIDVSIPYGQLFTGEGSKDRVFPYVFQNYFQTVEPYEFLSDRYLHLFTNHNFGTLLNNKGFFTPEVVLHNNFGIGNLSNAMNHQDIVFNIKNELFLETGLELRNIIKLNYFDVAYLGLGAGVFYRYGYHSLEKSSDNFAFKLAASFTFK